MSFLVGEALDLAREVYLNDVGAELFNNTVLIPFAKVCAEELNNKLLANGHQAVFQPHNTTITVPGTNNNFNGPYPLDMVEPQFLWERTPGQTSEDDWLEMERVWNLPVESPKERLEVWRWGIDSTLKLEFRPALADRIVKMQYLRYVALVSDANSTIGLHNVRVFFAARISALAAGHIGGNVEKASYIQLDADATLEDILGISATNDQGTPTRRKPFRR